MTPDEWIRILQGVAADYQTIRANCTKEVARLNRLDRRTKRLLRKVNATLKKLSDGELSDGADWWKHGGP